MRVAFTGASSTGKTTLANEVLSNPRGVAWGGKFITTNARGLLQQLGHDCIDKMTASEKRDFQISYLDRKLQIERSETDYLTDRSFIDVAAYWIDYNGLSPDASDEFISQCRENVTRYDAHFYFPVGLLCLELDGFRSADSASRIRIDALIRELAAAWGIRWSPLNVLDLSKRAGIVLDFICGDRP